MHTYIHVQRRLLSVSALINHYLIASRFQQCDCFILARYGLQFVTVCTYCTLFTGYFPCVPVDTGGEP